MNVVSTLENGKYKGIQRICTELVSWSRHLRHPNYGLLLAILNDNEAQYNQLECLICTNTIISSLVPITAGGGQRSRCRLI